jgi:3-methylfumaryl-CoA hydratase
MSLAPAAALHALLATGAPPEPAGAVPPLWHWGYFLDWPLTTALGPDGHPLTGGFLPPLSDRRRMFAGGRWAQERPLRFGRPAELTSSLVRAVVKQGRGGELLLVTVRSEVTQLGRVCLVDEQDFAYRSGPAAAPASVGTASEGGVSAGGIAAPERPGRLDRRSEFRPDPLILFRFSALTANSHRIHYDEAYARDTENYPDLLTQGPLLAVLMAEQIRTGRPAAAVRSLSYRLHRPVFAGERVTIELASGADHDDLAVRGPAGDVRASAVARYEAAGHPATTNGARP